MAAQCLPRPIVTKFLLLTVGSEPRALDPDLTNGVPEFKIESALFEGLVNSDPKDGSNWDPRGGGKLGTQ